MHFNIDHPSEAQIKQLMQLFSQGNVGEVIRQARLLERKFPKTLQLQNILCAAYLKSGNFRDAASSAEKAIALQPDYTRAHINLGHALANLGKDDEALESYRRAVTIEPGFAQGHNCLGEFLLSLKNQHEAAVECFTKAVEIEPEFFRAHFNLGRVLAALGRYAEAIEHLEKVFAVSPENPEVRSSLTQALTTLGQNLLAERRFAEAAEMLGKALELNGNDSATRHNLSCALTEQGNALIARFRYAEGVERYRKVVELNPGHFDALNTLGSGLMYMDRYAEAMVHFKAAIARNPGFAQAHHNLAVALLKTGDTEQALESYRRVLELEPANTEAFRQMSIITGFAPDEALYNQMSDLLEDPKITDAQRMQLSFGLAKAEEQRGKRERFLHLLQQGNRIRKQMLGYDIEADRALFERIEAAFTTGTTQTLETGTDSDPTPIFIVGMPRSGTSLVEQILACHSQVHGAGEAAAMEIAMQSFEWDESRATSEALSRLRESYLGWFRKLDVEEPFITDKVPLNFRWIGFILQALPEARIIHIRRDAVATCWSNFQMSFASEGNGYAYDLDDVAAFYKLYVELMGFWEKRFPGRIHHVSYETLTEEQERETRRMLEYCGLAWEEQCLDFHESTRAVATASTLQVRKRMYRGSSEAWKTYEDFLQPLVEQLEGY